MWAPGSDSSVTCIACGAEIDREAAREYDKHGERWNREGKEFEFLCKSCYRDLSKTERDGLESRLVDAGAGDVSDAEFLDRYVDATRDDPEEPEERERE